MKKWKFISAVLLAVALTCTAFSIRADGYRTDPISVAAISSHPSQTKCLLNTANSSDPAGQWALTTIMASSAWEITAGKPQTIIAILDTGIDEEHLDLAGQVIDRINFTNSPTTKDVYGHGTHIAGIIAALNNQVGITGLAYNCRLLNVKVADDGGWMDESSLASGIKWAADHDANVINISLYTLKESSAVEEALDYAWSKGAIIVGSSGNGVGEKKVYPACYDKCIAVAATDSKDKVTAWSGRGQWVDIAAPGSKILSTMPSDSYEYKSGTSMASAYVAGLAGLLFSMRADNVDMPLSNTNIRSIIESTCDPVAGGLGRINILRALESIRLLM